VYVCVYVCVADTWVDLPRMLGLSLTQPDKIHIRETDDPNWGAMMSLLQEMDTQFAATYEQWTQLLNAASQPNVLSEVNTHDFGSVQLM
jgi:hypothetical protein